MTNAEKFKEVFGIDFWDSLISGILESEWMYEEYEEDKVQRSGYEELHLTDELIDAIKNGKDIDVPVQDEYTLRIIYGSKEES